MRLIILFIVLSGLQLQAQELNINVKVTAPRLKTVDPKVFKSMERDINEFLNNTKWTEDEFEEWEKIEGTINATITEETSPTSFRVDFFVQSIRPVFNSNYKSQVLNLVDGGLNLNYFENQPIQNNFNGYTDELSSFLTFYAYVLLGLDYDTYEPFGGDPHFEIARTVMNNIPPSIATDTGWDERASKSTSRSNFIQNIFDPRIRPFRESVYEYHLKAMDTMHSDPERAKAVLLGALTTMQQVNASYLNSAVVQYFCSAKRDEIVEIFKASSRGQQSKVYDIMVKLNPAQASSYSSLK